MPKLTSEKSPDLDLAVFGELGDANARLYIESKYGIDTRVLAEKALQRFDDEMRETEP